MSGGLKREHFLSVDDYLDGETHAEERHEYIAGQVYATAGASEDHEVVAGISSRQSWHTFVGKDAGCSKGI